MVQAGKMMWEEKVKRTEMSLFQEEFVRRGLRLVHDAPDQVNPAVNTCIGYATVLGAEIFTHWGQGPKYPPGTCWIHWEYRQQVTPMCPVGIDCIHFKCPLPWDSNLPRPEQAGYI